jgi:hypothetical protein
MVSAGTATGGGMYRIRRPVSNCRAFAFPHLFIPLLIKMFLKSAGGIIGVPEKALRNRNVF